MTQLDIYLKTYSILTARLLISLFFLFSAFAKAQEYTLSGSVIDNNGAPVPFANVLLLNPDLEIAQGTITEDDGTFTISGLDDAAYQLKVTFVGYDDYLSDAFTMSEDEVFPEIVLKESSEGLEEITLIGRKPTITRKADRIVFNVENTIVSSGSSYDILKRTPSIISSNEALSVRGQSVSVYINDRKVQLSAEELKSLLENLGGNVIKSIEVIPNPPARYEAEGGPIVNIITSKTITPGYKGNVSTTGTYAIFPKYTFGTSHYFKNDKINLFANYNFNKRKDFRTNDSYVNFIRDNDRVAQWDIDFDRTTRTIGHNANVILDYAVNDKNTLSFSALGFISPESTRRNNTFTDVQGLGTVDDFTIDTNSFLDTEESNIALDLKYDLALEKGSLSTNVHYTQYNRDRTQDLTSLYRDESNTLFQTVDFFTDALQDIEIYTGQLDYETTFGKWGFEAGGKVSVIDSRAAIDYFEIEDDNPQFDSGQSDDFLYDENVYAGYLSLQRDWDKWSIKGGIRAEQTESVGTSLVLDTTLDLNYLEWFPSAFVQYSPSENHSFSIDYARRLERPKYQDLNPFAYFITENNFSVGNPNLQPSFGDAFNFNYTLKGAYSFDLYYRDNGAYILPVPLQNNDTFNQRTESQNAIASTSYGLDFTHGKSVTKWWYAYLYTSLFHEDNTFIATESGGAEVTNEVEGLYFSLGNYLTLNKARTFTGEVSIEYFSKFISGAYEQESTTNLSLGLRHSFWKKRASLSVNVNDILGKANALIFTRYLNQDNGYLPIPETRYVRVGFTYNFGNFRLDDNNRDIDKKERERLGSSQ